MNMSTPDFFIVEIEHSNSLFTLSEVCERCGAPAEIIIEMVEYGIISPIAAPISAQPKSHWQFNVSALTRLHRAQRLRVDLELDLPGLALSLELLDEIDGLKQQIASLQQQLQHRSY